MEFPAEIIEEILSRLPAKSLSRFRVVSEEWRDLIDSQKFIKTHHQIRRKSMTHRLIHNRYGLGPEDYSLNSLLTESAAYPTPLGDPNISQDVNILGCCDGLLCIMDPQGRFSLWNPATRICRKLPEIPEITVADEANRWFMCQFGFGWDESSGAHKVFADMFNYRLEKSKTKVYSSATNSWRTLESSCGDLRCMSQSKGECVSGKLHWNKRTTTEWFYAKGTEWIVTFDLKSEVFARMELPCDPKGSYSSWLGEVEGRLSVVFGYTMHLDVWVMKEYGVKESWEKVVEIPFVFERDPYKSFPQISAMWIGDVDGEILLVFGSYIVVYHPRRNLLLPLKEIKGSFSMHVYVESLVSPFTHTTI